MVIANTLIPMLQSCASTSPPEGDDVCSRATPAVHAAVRELRLWPRIVEAHFSYDEGSEERRNRFAFNGLLTQLANALVNSTCPMEGGGVLEFVSSRLDWTNTLENTPLTAMVFSKKTRPNDDDVESDDEEHEADEDVAAEEGAAAAATDKDEAVADPEPTLLSPVRAVSSRVALLSGTSPKAVGEYSSPPRPRLLPVEPEEEEEEKAEAVEQPEESFNAYSFWALPIDEL